MLNWFKNLFKKAQPPVAKFRVVPKRVKFNKKIQETIIKLKNGEVRHLRRVSSEIRDGLDVLVDLETGQPGDSQTELGGIVSRSDAQTINPPIVKLKTPHFEYLDDQGNYVVLQSNDVQEIIVQPVRSLPDFFEATILVLEPIAE